MADPVSRLIAALEGELDHQVNGLISGRLSPAEWHNAVLQELADHHTAALMLGRHTDRLDDAGRQMVLRTLADQAGYLGGLTDAIEAGELSDARIRSRTQAYAGSIKGSYFEGATDGADLPFYPTQDCECGNHCQCSWQERRPGEWYWVLGIVATSHCPTCVLRADGSPYEG